MLLSKKKSAARRLLSTRKTLSNAESLAAPASAAGEHDKQLAVVDAVEWAVERWASPELVEATAEEPRAAHAAHLIAALVYLDSRFARLDEAFVSQVIERVAGEPEIAVSRPRLDAKAAAALLAVEVGAFRR